jgi:hypothetical protein
MDNFKKYHNVEKEITLESKMENDYLYVSYKDKWILLTQKSNVKKFYSFRVIQQHYGAGLCHELGIARYKGKAYSREYYKQNVEKFRDAMKRYKMKKL